MRISVRVWQTALFVTVIVVGQLVVSAWISAGHKASIEEIAAAQRLNEATALADLFSPFFPLDGDNAGELRDRVKRIGDALDEEIVVYDREGALVASRLSREVPDSVLRRAHVEGGEEEGRFAEVDFEKLGLVIAARPIFDSAGLKVGVVVVGNEAREARQALRRVNEQLTVAFWVALVVAGAVGLFFSEIITRQVTRLSRAAAAIAEGDFDQRLPKRWVPDEITDLAESYNRMAAQLGHAFDTLRAQDEAQRQFVANASHELRTPVAALKGFVELLDDGAKEKPEVRDDFIRTMRAESDRLQRLVEELFTLARFDSGAVEMDIREHAVVGIIAEVVHVMKPLADERGVDLLSRVAPAKLLALCDRDRIEQVLVGFIDNALKHTKSGDSITVWARLKAGDLEVGVTDTGDGIPAEALPHIFDRFYRVESERGEPKKGAGLGLAIASEIIDGHGSRIAVRSIPGEGAEFSFKLQVARA